MNLDDERTDKASWAHNYLMIYDRIIRRPPERILEIGVYQGGSLKVWADEWPNAELHGIDIDPALIASDAPGTIHIGDAYSRSIMGEIWLDQGFDLIIDDGPHTELSQLFTASMWAQCVNSGGTLVIEDVPDEPTLQRLASVLPDDMRRQSFSVTLDGFSSRYQDPRWSRMLVAYR